MKTLRLARANGWATAAVAALVAAPAAFIVIEGGFPPNTVFLWVVWGLYAALWLVPCLSIVPSHLYDSDVHRQAREEWESWERFHLEEAIEAWEEKHGARAPRPV
jgi:hypothetical protein